jgi:hypothetical protein
LQTQKVKPPKQGKLPFGAPARAPRTRKKHKYEEQNLEAAEVILRDIERYGGEEALAVRWARAFLARRGA